MRENVASTNAHARVRTPIGHRLRRLCNAALVLTIVFTSLATAPIPAQESRILNGHPNQPPASVRPNSANDVDGIVRLAAWAAEQDSRDDAMRLYRAALRKDPTHHEAWLALNDLASEERLRIDEDAVEAAEKKLAKRFRRTETSHFVILSDAEAVWTQRQSDRLERSWHQFNRFVRKMELRPLPLRHKLMCILFNDFKDYSAFARAHDAVQEAWIAGYYSPMHDRIVFYNVASSPDVIAAEEQLDEMEDELQDFRDQLHDAVKEKKNKEADLLRGVIERYRDHLACERKRLSGFENDVSTATTIHEATHQLMFHTNIQSVQIEYPFWISEGLATSFETDDPRGAFGPDVTYEPRQEGFERAVEEGYLLPLREFVTITHPTSNDGAIVAAQYNQSYALLTWLYRHHQDDLRDYLLTMARRERGRLNAAQHLEVFESAFGSIDRIERAWLRDVRRSGISIVKANETADIR